MKQDRYQLAKRYEEQIMRIRKDIENMEKVTHMSCRSPYNMNMNCIPEVTRDLSEFPRMKAAIVTALEEELNEYENKFKNL